MAENSEQIEEFRKIKGWDRYSISNKGRVRNDKTGRILRLGEGRGYSKVMLCSGHGNKFGYRNLSVHRLVAEAFIGPSNGLQVNHINGVRIDNRAENLEFVTGSENMRHAIRLGLVRMLWDEAGNFCRLPTTVPSHRDKYRPRNLRQAVAA